MALYIPFQEPVQVEAFAVGPADIDGLIIICLLPSVLLRSESTTHIAIGPCSWQIWLIITHLGGWRIPLQQLTTCLQTPQCHLAKRPRPRGLPDKIYCTVQQLTLVLKNPDSSHMNSAYSSWSGV